MRLTAEQDKSYKPKHPYFSTAQSILNTGNSRQLKFEMSILQLFDGFFSNQIDNMFNSKNDFRFISVVQ